MDMGDGTKTLGPVRSGSARSKAGAAGGDTADGTVYCFGDGPEVLKYTMGRFVWDKIKYDNNASYDGSLKYMSSCTSLDGKIFLTGGVLISNNHPSSACYELSTRGVQKNMKKKNM